MLTSRFHLLIYLFLFIIGRHSSPPQGCSYPPLINSFHITFHHHIPISFFLVKTSIKFLFPRRRPFLLLLLLLSGDIELNPGPFNICTYNIRSLTKPAHFISLPSLATDFSIYLFCLTETWISPKTTPFEINSWCPPNFSLYSYLDLLLLHLLLLLVVVRPSFYIIPALAFPLLLMSTSLLRCLL